MQRCDNRPTNNLPANHAHAAVAPAAPMPAGAVTGADCSATWLPAKSAPTRNRHARKPAAMPYYFVYRDSSGPEAERLPQPSIFPDHGFLDCVGAVCAADELAADLLADERFYCRPWQTLAVSVALTARERRQARALIRDRLERQWAWEDWLSSRAYQPRPERRLRR